MISSAKHNRMVLVARSYRSIQSSSSIFAGFCDFKVFNSPCCTNRSFTLVCHNPKLPWPSNFTTSNLAPPDIAILTRSDTTCWENPREKPERSHKNENWPKPYKGTTPPLTQNLKTLGLWVFFLICCSTFSFIPNMGLRLTLEYLTISPSSESHS